MKKVLLITAIAGLAFAYTDNCTMCHGASAVNLNTLTPAQIEAKMKAFKTTKKGDAYMVSIAQKMTDKDIKEVAEKYGKK